MANALDPATSVYQGFWNDRSRDGINGLTWTLRPTHSIILTNSLTLFVAITSVQLWTIIRYTLHQLGASPPPQMTPHLRSEQVILRNAGSDLATARHMLSLAWKSRRTTGRRSLRSYSIGAFAIVYAILFMLSGIFSNRAVSARSINGGSAVIVRSENCGVWNDTYLAIANGGYTNDAEFQLYTQNVAKQAHDVQLSLEYAQECYFSQSSNMLSPATTSTSTASSSLCHSLKSSSLKWETNEGTCPFDKRICHGRSRTVVLDTGIIDSQQHLGINALPGDRLTYRRNTTCAALDDTNYITGLDGTVTNFASQISVQEAAYAYYGPSLYKGTSWTYSYANFASFYNIFSAQVSIPYQVDVERAWAVTDPPYSPSDFDPIQELAQIDADLTLLFLSFPGMYLGEINDPWFSAHKPKTVNNSIEYLAHRYARDKAISTLGCTEQHQFCTDNGTCTGFLGFDQIQNVNSFNNALTPHQNVTFDRMLRALAFSTIGHVVENLGVTTTPMLASSVSITGVNGVYLSQTLPDRQWETELQFWHSIAMSQFQRGIVQWATGQIAPSPQYVRYLLPPIDEQDVWFCENLIVPSTFYQSFSVVAIIIIVVLGTAFIVLSLTIEKVAVCIRRCLQKAPPRGDWGNDDLLGGPTRGKTLSTMGTRMLDRHRSLTSWDNSCEGDIGLLRSPRSNKRRVSSQVLAPNHPAFDFVNDHSASGLKKSDEVSIELTLRPESGASQNDSVSHLSSTRTAVESILASDDKGRRSTAAYHYISSLGDCDKTVARKHRLLRTKGRGTKNQLIGQSALATPFENPRKPPLPPSQTNP